MGIDSPQLQLYKSLKFVATAAVLLVLVIRRYAHRLHLIEGPLGEDEQPFILTTRREPSSIYVAWGNTRVPLYELGIGLLFLLLAAVWMVCSDMVLDWLNHDPLDTLPLETEKGFNFLATAVLLLLMGLRESLQRWRQAEQHLRESEERFQLAGRAASDVIWDWTIETNKVWWSDSFGRLFGYTREEVLPTMQAWLERIHPEDKVSRVEAIDAVFRSERLIWAGEYRFRRKDGTYAFVQDRACVIRDAAGKAVRVVGGMTDITASKEAEQMVERSRRQLRLLSARLQSLREEERARIAREIHDELGQTLTGLKMDLRWTEKHLASESNLKLRPILDKIVGASGLVDDTIASVQRIAAELRPGVLEELGLTAALRHEAQRFQERTGVRCRLQVPESLPELSCETATTVFRVFQESLTNVARHSEAKEVEVQLACQSDGLVLRVTDDGKGIRPSELEDGKSLGLVGMKERAQSLGGEVTVQPTLPHGTVVELALPLSSHNTLPSTSTA